MRLLVIEDNKDLVSNIYDYFEPLGYEIDAATNGYTGLAFASESNYDAIILDVMLPGIDGFSLCRKLRSELAIQSPVIMLTAKGGVDDIVSGLSHGADDYLVKPFSLVELAARIQALVRRSKSAVCDTVLTVGELELDEGRYLVRGKGKNIELTPIAFKILLMLMRSHPRIVSREELERSLWGDHIPSDGALRVHIHTLRKIIDKFFENPIIVTVPGIGYRLEPDNA